MYFFLECINNSDETGNGKDKLYIGITLFSCDVPLFIRTANLYNSDYLLVFRCKNHSFRLLYSLGVFFPL